MNVLKQRTDSYLERMKIVLNQLSNVQTNNNSTIFLKNLIPEADTIFNDYLCAFSAFGTPRIHKISYLIEKHYHNFHDQTKPSLEAMILKTFNHYHEKMDQLTERTINLEVSFNKAFEQKQMETKELLDQKQHDFENEIKEMNIQHDEEMKKLKEDIQAASQSLKANLESERQRLEEHFKKMLEYKNTSLKMVHQSLSTVENETNAIQTKNDQEFQEIQNYNNKLLSEHSKDVFGKLSDKEKQIKLLQQQISKLLQIQNSLEPDIENKWSKRQKELNDKFAIEDQEYQNEMDAKKEIYSKVKANIENEEEKIIQMEVDCQNKLNELTTNYKQQLEEKMNKKSQIIEKEINSKKEKYDYTVKKLQEHLQKIKTKMDQDKGMMNNRLIEKKETNDSKIENLETIHKQEMNEIQDEINLIHDEIQATKDEWEKQKNEIQSEYSSDLKEVELKREKDRKYYEAKSSALRKELDHILEENSALMDTDDSNQLQNEIQNLKLQHEASENELEKHIKESASNKISARLNEELQKLKEKHDAEKNLLLQESSKNQKELESLQAKANDIQLKNEKRLKNNSIVSSSFTSVKFVDAQLDQWRESFFVDCKQLKQKEADAIKVLDNSKLQFADAVKKTIDLREKFEKTAKYYEQQIELAKGKSEEELSSLRAVLKQKQEELSELEGQVEENARELKKNLRKIEQAEDRLSELRSNLSNEKSKIQNIIKQKYQQLFQDERRKTEVIVSDLEKLKNELEMKVEFLQHDLYLIETSNAAMEDATRSQTEKLAQQMKISLMNEYNEKVDNVSLEYENKTEEEIKSFNLKQIGFKRDEKNLKTKLENEAKIHEKERNLKLSLLNDCCIDILSQNSNLQKKIYELEHVKCKKCSLLNKSIRKLEKQLIEMQERDKKLLLEDQNKNHTIRIFGKKNESLTSI